MKRSLLLSTFLAILTGSLFAQSTPIFNQKMTDYFIYDPSRTGYSGGSLVFSHQQLSSGLENAPTTDFLGGHTRMFYDKVGLGGSVYYQEAGLIKTYRISLSGAYHLKLNSNYDVSFGLAPEITNGELNLREIFVLDMDDPVIGNYGNQSDFDISSGVSVHHERFDFGVAINRISSIMQGTESTRAFPGRYSAYFQGKVPLRTNLDLLEPMIFFNRAQDGTSQVDIGGFYSYEDLLFVGAMYRTPSVVAMSLGYNVKNRIVLGYSYQSSLDADIGAIGSAHEITIRLNFNKQYYQQRIPKRDIQTISPDKKGN